ncbi:MAG: thiamine-phosphate kinase [Campylobacter sp.]
MDKESLIIQKFQNSFIGDDGAVVDKFVYSKDLFAQNSHFKLGWLSLKEIGYKAMIVNFSDAVVMNAKPKFALLGLGLPKNLSLNQINELQSGITAACDEFGVKIIGGDTISSSEIFISVTIISHLCGKAVMRNAAKINDFIAFTGNIGNSLKGLKTLFRGGNIGSKSRFKRPVLKDNFFYSSAKIINSAMDISDGLSSDLFKLCKQSKCGAKITKKLSKTQLNSAEEYEILFTFSPKNILKIKNLAKKTRTKITIFGKITKGNLKDYAKKHHF